MHSLTLNQNLALSLAQSEEQFPVSFDDAWKWAGYTTKQRAKNKLIRNFVEGQDFLTIGCKTPGGGRPSLLISLTVDCFKSFAMMAGTAKGKEVRRYFIEAEKTLKIVQRLDPELVLKAEMIKDQIELAKLQAQAAQAQQNLVQFNHYVVTALPEPQQQKILGYSEVKTVEYRDRVIQGDDVIDDGNTLNKTALCHRLGFLTGKGKPDFKRLNQYLDRLPSEAFRLSIRPVENREVYREWLPELEELIERSERQRWLGE